MQRISVIIISYNQIGLLKEAVESVLNQTYTPFEIIICDDCSEDGSQDLIREYEAKCPNLVKGVFNPRNVGISRNRNSGIKMAQGDLVTWLDGDDIFRHRKLEFELEQFKNDSEVKWVYSQVIEINMKLNRITGRYHTFFKGMIFENVLSTLGNAPRNPLVDLSSLKEVGLFDENMEMYEDFDLCLRLAKKFKCSYCIEPLMEYRIHSSGMHSLPRGKHSKNLQYLHKNLNIILKNELKEKKRNLEKIFIDRVNYILILKYIEEKKCFRALVILGRRILFNPLRVFDSSTFVTFLKIVFPTSLINFLKEKKDKFQYE